MKGALRLALENCEGIVKSNWRDWKELASPDEFERWVKSRCNHIVIAINQELSEQPVKPLTDEQTRMLNFLYGAGELDGVWFGEHHPTAKDEFWWREHLRRLFDTPPAAQPTACQWTPMDDESGTWESACGQAWTFMEDGPVENNVRFCHGCGKPIEIKDQP